MEKIQAPIVFFLVGPLISRCCIAFTTNFLRKKEHEERQENETDMDGEDGEARGLINRVSDDDINGIYREVLPPMTAFTIVSISFLILGMNFEITFIVLISLICCYGFTIGVWSAWGASHFAFVKDKNGEYGEFEWKTKIWEFDETTVEVDNRFQDFGNNFTGTFLLGCSQITLMCLYILAVFEGGRPEFNERRVYVFYCLGSVIQVGYIVGKDLIRQLLFVGSKDLVFWARVLNGSRENEITYDWKDRWDNKLTQPEIWLRMLFSILINQVGMQLLLALLPLQLAGSTNPFDFVLNAVAAYFVIEMDDIETKVYDRFHSADDEETNGEEVGLIRSGAEAIAEYNVKAGLGFEPIYGSSLYVE